MIKISKTLSLVLAMLIVFALVSSCGNIDQPEVSQTPTAEPSTEPSIEPVPEPGNPTLPLTDEPVTFTYYREITQEDASKIGGYADVEGFKELARRTGVTIEWVSPTAGMSTEQYNLMITSGDYTDLIYGGGYTGGLDKAIEDNVFVRINDLVEKYAPNYKNSQVQISV